MSKVDDLEYYQKRADEELEAAAAAQDPAISESHRVMALHYATLITASVPEIVDAQAQTQLL